MKKDPNKYCINYEQCLLWAIIHDTIAHPLMALTFYKIDLFIKFHDFTSRKAWIRPSKKFDDVNDQLKFNVTFKEEKF